MQVTDRRDGKKYWVAKQADGKTWMTQNLDLEISDKITFTSENTDINPSDANGNRDSWVPLTTAYTSVYTVSNGTVSPAFPNNSAAYSAPYSAEAGDVYYYNTGNDNNEKATDLATCMSDNNVSASDCAHYHAGNYYNWNYDTATPVKSLC